MLRIFVLVTAFFCLSSWGLPITSLPGLNVNLTFSQFSGYITVDKAHNRNLFYWFVESQQNPKTDPVVVWFQGGPGCSSLIGLFTENGPFVPNFQGGLDINPLSWNRIANVLYVEAPAGVGFSFSDNIADYNTTDPKTAADNLKFLELFFTQEFPHYLSNGFWLTGESYAGAYVPQLAQLLLNQSALLSSSFKGIMLGNPVMGCPTEKAQLNTIQIELFFWHGLIPFSLYHKWISSECGLPNPNPPANCVTFYNEINDVIGLYDPDNLYTDFCTENATLDGTATQTPGCVSVFGSRNTYLNRADVQAAIHARPTKWVSCADNSTLNYITYWINEIPIYNYIFSKAPHARVLIYSGDVDIATVPHAYTQICLSELASPIVSSWRPWVVNGQTAGYVEVHQKYTYATVKGAGHEVPTYQPWSAYNMFERFLTNHSL
eukprot:Phypoly_transcript_09864.p1 GENE.Phypoly_transcript_09864~~Phypoly_transcript_09864.p1  ORF type:complete len:434 (+),score=38.22 Phypoly_transcript_09864:38-1339(+)